MGISFQTEGPLQSTRNKNPLNNSCTLLIKYASVTASFEHSTAGQAWNNKSHFEQKTHFTMMYAQ